MGERGGCGGCWCMLWRCSASQWEAGRGQGNREAMKEIFDAGHVPGLVALHEGRAIGWIQLDERAAFPRLERSRILRRVDDARVWSVSCFLVDRQFRRQGLSLALLRAACDWARERGAGILEGYPVDTPQKRYPAVYAFTGFVQTYRAAGFEEVARRSGTRPIMRRVLANG